MPKPTPLLTKLEGLIATEKRALAKALGLASTLEKAEARKAPAEQIGKIEAQLYDARDKAEDLHLKAVETAERLVEAVTDNFADEHERLAEF